LPYTKFFTLREVFGLAAPYPDNLEDNFDSKMDIALDAESPSDLTRIGFFDSFLSDRRYQVECSRLQAERIQKHGSRLMRTKWASDLLVSLDVADTPANLSLLNERLDACFYWDERCYLKARNLACAFAEEGDKPKMLANLSTAFQHKDHVLKGEQMPDPRSDDSFQKYIHDDDFIKLMKQIGYNRPPDMRRSINLTRPPFV
jgi:hypothetical protein